MSDIMKAVANLSTDDQLEMSCILIGSRILQTEDQVVDQSLNAAHAFSLSLANLVTQKTSN